MAGIKTLTSHSVPIGFSDLGGGLNSTASGLNVQNNEATAIQNIDFNVFGSARKRSGYTALNTSEANSGAGWLGLHWFEQADGTQKLVGVCGNEIMSMDGLDATWDDKTNGLTVTDNDDYLWKFITFNNTVGAVNGYDAPFQLATDLTATALGLPTNVTVPKFIEAFNNYTFIAHVKLSGAAKYSRVYWSNIDKLDTFTATHFNDVSVDDGQNITGLKTLGDRLVIFKDRSIWVAMFTGDADIPFAFYKTPSHVGCISDRSVQEVNNGLVFLAQDGLYFFDGANSTKISDRITTTLNTFNKSRFQYASSGYQRDKNTYWCSFSLSSQSQHRRVITWNSARNSFSLYKGQDSASSPTYYGANCYAVIHTSGAERIYFGDYIGFVYRGDTGADDYPSNTKTAISAFIKTKWFNFEDIVTKKGVSDMTVYYLIASASITIGYAYDFEDSDQWTHSLDTSTSSSVYGTAVYGTGVYASEGGAVKRVNLTGRGRVIRFNFKNDTLSETMRVDGIGLLPHLETIR